MIVENASCQTIRAPGNGALLAVGDCNTLGAGVLRGNSFPERVAAASGLTVKNCGYTMATSREGIALLRDNLCSAHTCVIVQFGLVDSYSTFKYAPYVLYYPDNILRKQLRSIVKKYKKICRNRGLHLRFGAAPVVPIEEYQANLEAMITMCGRRTIVLPETIPNHEEYRNPAIRRYNQVLAHLAEQHENCHLVALYEHFAAHLDAFYMDPTHANSAGYDHVADRILDVLHKVENAPPA